MITHGESESGIQALERIGALYHIEEQIRGHSRQERQAVREARAGADVGCFASIFYRDSANAVEEIPVGRRHPLHTPL
jgi:hypothetical protein